MDLLSCTQLQKMGVSRLHNYFVIVGTEAKKSREQIAVAGQITQVRLRKGQP